MARSLSFFDFWGDSGGAATATASTGSGDCDALRLLDGDLSEVGLDLFDFGRDSTLSAFKTSGMGSGDWDDLSCFTNRGDGDLARLGIVIDSQRSLGLGRRGIKEISMELSRQKMKAEQCSELQSG